MDSVEQPRAGTKDGDWREALRREVQQEPLVETRLTLDSLEGSGAEAAPRAVFIGLGLCSRQKLSQGLPLDLLGMLLPAERVRRAVGAPSLVVLVADTHALSNRFEPGEVEYQAGRAVETLTRLGDRLELDTLSVLRASALTSDGAYQAVHSEVKDLAPEDTDSYVTREVADIAHLQRNLGSIVKVGWTISASAQVSRDSDELTFDRSFRRWTGRPLCAVYCKAGRALDDAHPKVSPYVTVNPDRRVCLRQDEDVAARIASAQERVSRDTLRGVRNHLRAITRAYSQLVAPLNGPVEQRAQQVLERIWSNG